MTERYEGQTSSPRHSKNVHAAVHLNLLKACGRSNKFDSACGLNVIIMQTLENNLIKDDPGEQSSPRPRIDMTCQSARQPTVAAIEFMTFHHEVLVAFCKHTIELKMDTLVIAPSTGIQKAISRFAANSFEQLKELAFNNKTRFSLSISHSPRDTAEGIMEADAVFIGTLPQPPSKRLQANNSHSRHEEMITVVKEALKLNKLIYIVIHKPQVDAAQLISCLEPGECAKISIIYLSRQTAEFCKRQYPNHFRSELVMPAIGLHDSPKKHKAINSRTSVNMIVAGEISSKRRHYESLAYLRVHRKWLRSERVVIQVIGRIKLESWREKVLRLCALPAAWLFLVKYPSLLTLWLDGCLDLSMARYSKISDKDLVDAITDSTCLLDLKRKHYSDNGQTTGALGLAMTHAKPLISLEEITAIASKSQPSSAQLNLHQLVEKESNDLLVEKEALVAQFRKQLQKELISTI